MANRSGQKTYTYLFYWIEQDKAYYGYRGANKVSPENDLWTVYKGSSKVVDAFVLEYGEPDIVMIDSTFDSVVEAKEFEREMIAQFSMDTSDHWLNLSPSHKNFFHGKSHTAETRKKMSETRKGKAPNNKGQRGVVKQTPESIAKRAAANKGKKRTGQAKANMQAVMEKINNAPEFKSMRSERAKKAWETKRANGYEGTNKGRVFSAEARAAMSAGQKKRQSKKLNTDDTQSMVGSIENHN